MTLKERLIVSIGNISYALLINNHVGELIFSFLLALEAGIVGFFLIISSNQNGAKLDELDSRNILIFNIANHENLIISFSFIYTCLQVIMAGMLISLVSSRHKQDHIQEASILKFLCSIWMVLQRSLFSFLTAYLAVSSFKLISTSSSSFTKYGLILSNMISLFLYFFYTTITMNLQIVTIPIKSVPWSALNNRYLNLYEFLKIFMVVQEYYIGWIRDSHNAHIGYYVGLCLLIFLTNLQKPAYFSQKVSIVQKLALRLLFSLAITCLFRLALLIKLTEMLSFYPIIAFSSYYFLEVLEKRRNEQILKKIEAKEKLNQFEFMMGLQFMLSMVDRLNSVDEMKLSRFLYRHRIQCFNSSCVCNKYQTDVIEPFKKKESEQPLQQEAQKTKNKLPEKIERSKRSSKNTARAALYEERKEKNFTFIMSNEPDSNQRGVDNFNFSLDQQDLVDFEVIEDFKESSIFRKVLEDQELRQKGPNGHDLKDIQGKYKQQKFKTPKESLRYFYIWLIEQVFSEIQSEMDSTQTVEIDCYLLQAYFINTYLEKYFLSVFLILQLTHSKMELGFFKKIQLFVSEQLLLGLTQNNFKSSIGSFDYSLYLEGKRIKLEIENLYEQTTADIIQFWQKLKGQEIDVNWAIETGHSIASQVSEIKKYALKSDMSMGISKEIIFLYTRFYLDLLQDPISFNQMQTHFQSQIVSNEKIKKQFNQKGDTNFDNNSIMSNSGVCIVSAWGGERQNWEVLYVNKDCCDLLKGTSEQIIGRPINSIMSEQVAENHDFFMKRFFNDGYPRVLGRLRVVFAKDLSGYLVPITLRLNFQYNPTFKYSFIAQMDRIGNFNLFNQDANNLKMDDAIVIICNQDFFIQEVTFNLLGFIDMTDLKWKEYSDKNNQKRSLSNLIPDIEIILEQEIGNETDLNEALVNKVVKMQSFNEQLNEFDSSHTVPMILTFYQNKYGLDQNHSLTENIFILLPLFHHPDFEQIYNQNSLTKHMLQASTESYKGTLIRKASANQKDLTEDMLSRGQNQDQEESNEEGQMSSMNSSSSNSMDKNIFSANYAKTLLFSERTPKIIRANSYMFLLVILVFVALSIAFLVIVISKENMIVKILDYFNQITYLNSQVKNSLLALQELQLSVKFNLTQSQNISMERAPYYYQQLESYALSINELNIQGKANDYYTLGIIGLDLNYTALFYLSDIGLVSNQSVSYQTGLNLFTSYIADLNLSVIQSENPDLNFLTYSRSVTEKGQGKVSQLKRNLFFIYMNGLLQTHLLGVQEEQDFIIQVSQLSESITLLLKQIIYISMGILSSIIILQIPLLMKIYKRYQFILKTFSSIKIETIDTLIENGNKFRSVLQKYMKRDHEFVEKQRLHPSTQSSMLLKVPVQIKKRIEKKPVSQTKSKRGKVHADMTNHSQIELQIIEEKKEESLEEVPDQQEEVKKQEIVVHENISHQSLSRFMFTIKLKVFSSLLIFSAVLCSAMFISLTQSSSAFKDNTSMFQNIQSYYKRDACSSSLILYSRSQYIMNSDFTQVLTGANYSYIDTIISSCYANENKINSLKKKQPGYFESIQEELNSFEISDNLILSTVFYNDSNKEKTCSNIMNGVITSGLSTTMQQILSYAQNLNLDFASIDRSNSSALLELMREDSKSLQLVDLSMYCLKDIFRYSQVLCEGSIQSYYQKIQGLFLMTTGLYIGVTIMIALIVGLIVMARLKEKLLNFQNVMVLLPLDEMDHHQRLEIEQFLQF